VKAEDPARSNPANNHLANRNATPDDSANHESARLAPAVVEALLAEHGIELERFLIGVLRDPQLAADARQNALVKMMERGHTAQEETRKAWLFRVAYNEALLLRRRQATGNNVLRKIATTAITQAASADEAALREEDVGRVRGALDELPPEQRTVVRLRIYEQKTFKAIAAELHIPLGTALSRMRAALAQLKARLTESDRRA